MSALANSSPFTDHRTRVTEVAEVIVALNIDSVTTDGQRVALRFATRRGIVTVQTSLKSFLEKARAPLDSNNRPFSLRALDREVYTADAAQVPVTKGTAEPIISRVGMKHYGSAGLPPKLISQLRRAYFDQGRALEPRTVAYELGLSLPTVQKYFKRFAAEPVKAPITKPNGHLL